MRKKLARILKTVRYTQNKKYNLGYFIYKIQKASTLYCSTEIKRNKSMKMPQILLLVIVPG